MPKIPIRFSRRLSRPLIYAALQNRQVRRRHANSASQQSSVRHRVCRRAIAGRGRGQRSSRKAVPLILRRPRSGPRRMRPRRPGPHPSRLAEFTIGPTTSGPTRWLAPQDEDNGKLAHSRGASASEFCQSDFQEPPKQRREAERRQAHRPVTSAPHARVLPHEHASGAVARHTDKRYRLPTLRARSPLGAPRAALAAQIDATVQPRPHFVRTGGCGRYPHHRTHLQRCTSRTGHSAGRSDAQAARERGYKPRPREPHSLRVQMCLEATSLR
jgi:hypothetical protein